MTFVQALKDTAALGTVPVIADLKRRSPKEGDLFCGRDPLKLAEALAACGAPALSVVTEREHFDGSVELLRDVAASTRLPVLRKDFIRSARAVEETAEAGAAAALLIVSMLDADLLGELLDACRACGLEALVETHTLLEIEIAGRYSPPLVGVNNRDILRLERDDGTVETTRGLAQAWQKHDRPFIVSESAIETAEDVRSALQGGADAVLVGTAILKAADPAAKYRELSEATV